MSLSSKGPDDRAGGAHSSIHRSQRGANTPATEMSSSRSGQFTPMPPPTRRQCWSASGAALRNEGTTPEER
jgi:hypothetical protein